MPPADNARFLIEASKKRSQQARERAEDQRIGPPW
jgi:hypothetical protein